MLASTAFAGPALGQTSPELIETVKSLQAEVRSLRQELDAVKAAQHTQPAAVPTATSATPQPGIAYPPQAAPSGSVASVSTQATPPSPPGTLTTYIGKTNVKITAGGFVEAASIYRSKDEIADIGSTFGGIPLGNTSQSHTSEFRGSARQSRLSLLVQGDIDDDVHAAAYYEADFLGAAPTANSNESNSYNLRMRNVYATLDWDDLGLHFLGGQNWSLLTMEKTGMMPRDENTPLTIDAQYVPGFDWTRQWQFRVVKDISPMLHAGFSIENPQTTIGAGPNPVAAGTVTGYPGGSLLGANGFPTYSSDVAPDVIGKLAFDPGWGHFEAYGIGRFFHDQVGSIGAAGGTNSIVMGGGGGADALLPIIPKVLDVQVSTLIGNGIGRYGTSQLSDVTEKADGQFSAIPEVMALVGVIAHPSPKLDVYAYAGGEMEQKDSSNYEHLAYGYGNSAYNNTGCSTIGGSCQGQTKDVWQATIGDWWKFYKGPWGTVQFGLQYSFTRRDLFEGVGGNPHTDDNMLYTSFRYYPF